MSNDSSWGRKQVLNPAGVSLDASGANTAVITFGQRVAVSRLVLVTTVAQTVADATITVAVRDVDDGNSTTKGTFTLPFTGSATDDLKYVDLIKPSTSGAAGADSVTAVPTTVYTTSGKGPIYIEANQELALTSDGGGNAGTYMIYAEGWPEGNNVKDDSPAMSERTFTAA